MSFVNSDSFVSSFPIWIFFIFTYVTALSRIAKKMLNRSGESRQSCLSLDFRGKIFINYVSYALFLDVLW